jgi:hypothetical protein
MAFDMSKTASEMLRIADALEREASERTYFVCDHCNHTASLSSINGVRSKVASESGIEKVSPVSVNDRIACPVIECPGVMRYEATDESDRYYIDVEAGKEEEPELDVGVEEDAEVSPEEEEPVEDSKFDPVDEQDETKPVDEPLEEEVVEEAPADETEEEPKKKPKKKDKADDEKAVPKFTEMPEDMKDLKMKAASSSDRFYQSVARYSNV